MTYHITLDKDKFGWFYSVTENPKQYGDLMGATAPSLEGIIDSLYDQIKDYEKEFK